MTLQLRAFGLAFAAVLAMGALSAPAAQAASFHSETAHTILSGSQPMANFDVYTVKAGTIKCTSATYSGTASSATTETITVTPSFSGCTAFGFVSTPIDVNGCTYTFNAGNDDLVIDCFAAQGITVTAFNCHVRFVPQTVSSGIGYGNAGSGSNRDITITSNLSGLKYTQESKSFPGCTNGSFTDGLFSGSTTLKGTNTSGTAVGVWHS